MQLGFSPASNITITQLDTYVREIPLTLVILSFVCNCIVVQLGFSPASNITITQLDTYVRETPLILVILSFVCNCTVVQLGVYPVSIRGQLALLYATLSVNFWSKLYSKSLFP